MNEKSFTRADWLWGLLGGVCLLLGGGLSYPLSNQHQYFIHGLRLADPSFVPGDWFTWQTTHYHFAFGYLLWLLQQLGSIVVVSLVAQGLTMIALAFGVLLLCNRFSGRPRLVYGSTIAWIGLASLFDMDLGFLNFVSGYLQPSEIAAALLVLGFALLLDRRLLAAGVVLGLSGLFHASFMITVAPLLVAVVWFDRRRLDLRALLHLGLPLVLLWGVNAAFIVYQWLQVSEADARFAEVLIHIRSAHHYVISAWSGEQSLAWCLWVGFGALAVHVVSREREERGLFVSFCAVLAIAGLGVAAAAIGLSQTLTTLVPWRIAPLALLLGLIALTDRWVEFLLGETHGRWPNNLFRIGMLAAGSYWAWRSGSTLETVLRFGWLSAFPVARFLGWVSSRFRDNPTRARAAALVVIVVLMLGGSVNGLMHRSSLLGAYEPRAAEMIEPVLEATPERAVLVVPPTSDWVVLRIQARRALVVDFKCFPMMPGEAGEWYRRLTQVCGVDRPGSAQELLEGYLQLDGERARRLHARYGATHVIVMRRWHRGDLSGLREVARTPGYSLLEIR